MTRKVSNYARNEKREWFALLKTVGDDGEQLIWSMARRLAKEDAKRNMQRIGARIRKIDASGVPGEQVMSDVLAIIEGEGKLRHPRDPRTRTTPLAPGQVWTVALGTLNGRVRRADYHRYLKSAEWHQKRQWWWDRSGRPSSCAACGTHWSLHAGDLHHRTYVRLGYELLEDLVQLCERCHKVVHANIEAWADLEDGTDRVIDQIRSRS